MEAIIRAAITTDSRTRRGAESVIRTRARFEKRLTGARGNLTVARAFKVAPAILRGGDVVHLYYRVRARFLNNSRRVYNTGAADPGRPWSASSRPLVT